ncbi:MAG: DUF4411 family protein [Leptospiraceae bacterium]|nr:DUF4411 family protein [Leptospiraceae bacterium]
MAYLLDANVFIQAKNLHYGFDFCPAFWDWLVEQNERKNLFSIEKVKDELLAGSDELSEWAQLQGKKFFLSPDPKVFAALPRISEWVVAQGFDIAAVNTFFQVADYYLVSHAHAQQYTLVTHEIPAYTPKKIKIPNVCVGMGIKFINPYEMLRTERARFVLAKEL